MKRILNQLFFFCCSILLLSSCGMYRQNIMFQTKEGNYQELAKIAEKNYLIQPGDQIGLSVYSNNGEIIIDPNFQLRKEIGLQNNVGFIEKPVYLVKPNGQVKLPMIGNISIQNMTLVQVDSLLSNKYSDFYIDAFAATTLLNRRVIVLGATGGQVIPLTNENMNLLEIIAIAGGISNSAKAHNIRLIRGDKTNPQVETIDLSTIKGMQMANLEVQPNDVIYIEPIRKVVTESIRDISPILTLLTSILTLSIILSRN